MSQRTKRRASHHRCRVGQRVRLTIVGKDEPIIAKFMGANDKYCRVRIKGKKKQWPWCNVETFGILKHNGGMEQ